MENSLNPLRGVIIVHCFSSYCLYIRPDLVQEKTIGVRPYGKKQKVLLVSFLGFFYSYSTLDYCYNSFQDD